MTELVGRVSDTGRTSTLPAVRVAAWLGIELDEVSTTEKVVSGAGGAVAIVTVYLVSQHALGQSGAAMLVASMGASAVLLFAVPHGQLSQPWPVLAGHVVSALIGVFVSEMVAWRPAAAGLAVGGAIFAMHLLKCIHPPGGATALTAVIGGARVWDLGYGFIWHPVVVNVVCILVVAVAFNAFFPWRRYPKALNRPRSAPGADEPTHDEIVTALRTLDSFIDVTEDDLRRLVSLLAPAQPARRRSSARR